MNSKTKKILISSGIVLAVLLIAFAVFYFVTRPVGTEGAKTITVQVFHADASTKDFDISTDEEFLRGALEQIGLVKGSESEFGLFITTVDGYTADDAKQEWWCVTKGGETVMTGVDMTPIADGDVFELTLTSGY
ncbi:MAG: DUF4430 domain-containing protein [Oscillospiraceae bacterium]